MFVGDEPDHAIGSLRLAGLPRPEPFEFFAVASASISNKPTANDLRTARCTPLFNVRAIVGLASEIIRTAAGIRLRVFAPDQEARTRFRETGIAV